MLPIKNEYVNKLAQNADMIIGRNLSILSRKNIKRAIVTKNINVNPIFWNNGVLSWALRRFGESNEKVSFRHHSRLTRKPRVMHLVDDTLYFYANYDYISAEEKISVYDFLEKHERDSAGSVLYRAGYPAAFLDTIGMISPFLIRYGREYNMPEATTLGVVQFRAFFNNGFDDISNLPYHGYDISRLEKCGVIGWGRGLGWLMIGLSESLGWLNEDADEYKELDRYFLRMATLALKYLRKNGSFSWQLQAIDGHEDTSVASMIGYAIEHYNYISGKKLYEAELNMIYDRLKNNINNDGLVLNSSAECKGFSMYPQIFETNSWGQAFVLLFFLERDGENR